MYIQTSKHHIEHINSMTYDKGSGLKSWRAARESQGHLRFHTWGHPCRHHQTAGKEPP